MKKKRLITSALPYINGVKHLGNLVGSLLPADIFARFSRQQGHEVLYICGTDEHGAPAELGALEEELSTEAYCTKYHDIQKKIYDDFGISFDFFGRSSSKEHHELTQKFFLRIEENGFIYEDTIKQFYSNTDLRFLPDRYIEGICPKCSYKEARGDQCDSCGALLDPEDLLEARSSLSGSTDIEIRETKHLFLDLARLEKRLTQWLSTHPEWPATVKGISSKWIKEGIKSRCITRDLAWGVRVPKAGYENKVFYVWFDAPLGYISFTKQWAKNVSCKDAWKEWWQSDQVEYFQYMAKDNVPFHAVFWPAMLMATNEKWQMVDFIKGVNWLVYDGGKFSTSKKRGVFTDKALELYPPDYWRYSLFAMMPENADANFSFEGFAQAINKDLADGIGNYTSRICKLIDKHFEDSTLPEGFVLDEQLGSHIAKNVKNFAQYMEHNEFRKANTSLREMWTIGNEYVSRSTPWTVVKEDKSKGALILKNCIFLLRVFTEAMQSITPNIVAQLRKVHHQEEVSLDNSLDTAWLEGKVTVTPLEEMLVKKISDEEVESLKAMFSGH